MIEIKRVYEPETESDGTRVLVERLWPRGVKKESLHYDYWLKEVAPSTELRKWFSHDVSKWDEFQEEYCSELDANPESYEPILDSARKGNVTLLYSSRDTEHNNAVCLKGYLKGKLD
ncbi:hypothetical protein TRVA0_098S00144 [Trichomonascus vanleenenianus]|uniref:DUF488 domain-containing protein n=1 Tax=Trichomonascus vanleenenianus TaxID=2268995 RepID=UPI003ECB9F66